MRRGLFSKMLSTYTIIIAISFIVVAGFLSFWFEGYYYEQRNIQLKSESKYIKGAIINYSYGEIGSNRLEEIVSTIADYAKSSIWVVDNYGYVYAVSSESQDSLIGKQILTKELEKLRNGEVIEKRNLFPKYFEEPVHTYIIPVMYRDMFKGAIVMNSSILDIKGPLKKVYEIIWGCAVLAIISSCIVTYYFSQRIIIRPLAQINNVAEKISKGEVDKRVHIESEDEIGALAKSFNSMADSLEEVEKNRREFISNVSHEIRSPITSIKGFIGGMIDGIIPLEKQKYYLNLTYEEIQRLTRLINDLLDLSAIEAGRLSLRITKINLNEIIGLTVIKFETKIKSKNLNVDVYFDKDESYIYGDYDRIVQVITNLIDNAIKYATNGGNLKISTKTKSEKVLVSVYNDGLTIPNEDLKHIWDRFYKVDKSRTSKVSTGLGLPIVRSILTQHGEDIWIENQSDKGVMFTFTLRRVKSVKDNKSNSRSSAGEASKWR